MAKRIRYRRGNSPVTAPRFSRGSNSFENSAKQQLTSASRWCLTKSDTRKSVDRARDLRLQEASQRRGRWKLLKSMVRNDKWTRCSGGSGRRWCLRAPTSGRMIFFADLLSGHGERLATQVSPCVYGTRKQMYVNMYVASNASVKERCGRHFYDHRVTHGPELWAQRLERQQTRHEKRSGYTISLNLETGFFLCGNWGQP